MVTPSSDPFDVGDYDTRAKREVLVSRICSISASVRRITLSGNAIHGLPYFLPTGWAKIFLPEKSGEPSVGRAYTLRNHKPELGEVDIDVVLHEEGPFTTWARSATPGCAVSLAGPRGGFEFNPNNDWMLLAGDLSAMPAIASIADILPEKIDLQILVSINDTDDLALLPSRARANCRWTTQGAEALLSLAQSAHFSVGGGEVWAAGESTFARSLRRYLLLERKLNKLNVHCTGYWKHGTQDHRESS